jgi:hypothetical protein
MGMSAAIARFATSPTPLSLRRGPVHEAEKALLDALES